MAYEKNSFLVGRGTYNTHATQNNMVPHYYTTASDTFAQIIPVAPAIQDYFSSYFGFATDQLRENDLLWIQDLTKEVRLYRVDTLDPIFIFEEGSLSNIEKVTYATTWGGAFSTPVSNGDNVIVRNSTVKFPGTGVGTITLELTSLNDTSDAVAAISATTPIPAGYRPLQDLVIPIRTSSNDIGALGIIVITTAGAISVYRDANLGDFSTITGTGFSARGITWTAGT